MADLDTVIDPRAALTRIMSGLGIRLPLRVSFEDIGVILDADGRDVATIDVNSERTDAEVESIATWFALAVNICGGIPPEARTNG
jgi:hypothetical protein